MSDNMTFYLCIVCSNAFADSQAASKCDVPGILYDEDPVGLRVYDGPRPDGEVVVFQAKDRNPCCKDHVVEVYKKGLRFKRTPERGVEIVGAVRVTG